MWKLSNLKRLLLQEKRIERQVLSTHDHPDCYEIALVLQH
ncbi:hypothetical protein NIES2104_04890 [Leptolyngbya sp. NIES-2104]|nr:hypothetical protein NIES2104_04890 [Leptolyngbya sp. NIES-2104]